LFETIFFCLSFQTLRFNTTGQMAQVIRYLHLVRKVWVQISSKHVSHTLPRTRHRCKFELWALAQSRGDG